MEQEVHKWISFFNIAIPLPVHHHLGHETTQFTFKDQTIGSLLIKYYGGSDRARDMNEKWPDKFYHPTTKGLQFLFRCLGLPTQLPSSLKHNLLLTRDEIVFFLCCSSISPSFSKNKQKLRTACFVRLGKLLLTSIKGYAWASLHIGQMDKRSLSFELLSLLMELLGWGAPSKGEYSKSKNALTLKSQRKNFVNVWQDSSPETLLLLRSSPAPSTSSSNPASAASRTPPPPPPPFSQTTSTKDQLPFLLLPPLLPRHPWPWRAEISKVVAPRVVTIK